MTYHPAGGRRRRCECVTHDEHPAAAGHRNLADRYTLLKWWMLVGTILTFAAGLRLNLPGWPLVVLGILTTAIFAALRAERHRAWANWYGPPATAVHFGHGPDDPCSDLGQVADD